MTSVALMTSVLKHWATGFDEASELAFNQGNSELYSKYSEVATQLRECADNLGDVPAIGLQSSTESVTVSHQNDIFIHPLPKEVVNV